MLIRRPPSTLGWPRSRTKKILKRRGLAYLVDQGLVFTLHQLVFSVYLYFMFPTLGLFHWRAQDFINKNFLTYQTATYVLSMVCYYVVTLWIGEGQTIGQKIFHLRLDRFQKINHKNMAQDNSYNHAHEVLSYMLFATGMAFCHFVFGFPFLYHLLNREGVGIQDWISDLRVHLTHPHAAPNVSAAHQVIYMVAAPTANIHGQENEGAKILPFARQTLSAGIVNSRETQLTLQLDPKNPSEAFNFPVTEMHILEINNTEKERQPLTDKDSSQENSWDEKKAS